MKAAPAPATLFTLVGSVTAVQMVTSSASACDVFAERPYGTSSASGPGGRRDCSSRVQTKTDLKTNRRGLPDPVRASRSGTVTNVRWIATWDGCDGTFEFYVDTNSSTGQYSTSTRRTLSC